MMDTWYFPFIQLDPVNSKSQEERKTVRINGSSNNEIKISSKPHSKESEYCFELTGRRGGEVARTLASHQCDSGSTPDLGSMWAGFAVPLRRRGFSPGTPVSSPNENR